MFINSHSIPGTHYKMEQRTRTRQATSLLPSLNKIFLRQLVVRQLMNSPKDFVSTMARIKMRASDCTRHFSSFHAPDLIYCHTILALPQYLIKSILTQLWYPSWRRRCTDKRSSRTLIWKVVYGQCATLVN